MKNKTPSTLKSENIVDDFISIEPHSTIKLNEKQFDLFIDICENPPEISENLKKAIKNSDDNKKTYSTTNHR
jgi:hypothetical protein